MGDGGEESLLPTSVGRGRGLGKWRSPVVLLPRLRAGIVYTLPSIEAAAINKDGRGGGWESAGKGWRKDGWLSNSLSVIGWRKWVEGKEKM